MTSAAHTTGTTNPLDQIVKTEKEQEHRLQTALTEMEAAERKASHDAEQKIAQSDEKLRNEAREELQEWRTKELPGIAKKEEDSTSSVCAALEKSAASHGPAVVKHLTKTMLSSDFLSHC